MEARLRRGLFGYSRKSVSAVVNDRDISIVKASQSASEAEERTRELAAELDRSRAEVADLQARNRILDDQVKGAAERFSVLEQSSTPTSSEDVTEVLHAAERALSRLTENARRNAEQELGETERERDELRTEIQRLAAWRDRMGPLEDAIPRSIADVRREASDIADRVVEAVAPLKDALDGLAARLSELALSPEAPIESPIAEREIISLGDAAEEPATEIPEAPPRAFAQPTSEPPRTE